jgi:hypothetical protein
VKHQNEHLCFLAVERDPMALEYVRKQTLPIVMKAIELNGAALHYVHKQTERICLEAVKDPGSSVLSYVENQTYRVCLTAVLYDREALDDIRDPKIQARIQTIVGDEDTSSDYSDDDDDDDDDDEDAISARIEQELDKLGPLPEDDVNYDDGVKVDTYVRVNDEAYDPEQDFQAVEFRRAFVTQWQPN